MADSTLGRVDAVLLVDIISIGGFGRSPVLRMKSPVSAFGSSNLTSNKDFISTSSGCS